MREIAKKILFETLKFQCAHEVLFSTGKITDNSALIETVIDAMEKYKNTSKQKDDEENTKQLTLFCHWYKTTDFNCEGHSETDCVNEYLNQQK